MRGQDTDGVEIDVEGSSGRRKLLANATTEEGRAVLVAIGKALGMSVETLAAAFRCSERTVYYDAVRPMPDISELIRGGESDA